MQDTHPAISAGHEDPGTTPGARVEMQRTLHALMRATLHDSSNLRMPCKIRLEHASAERIGFRLEQHPGWNKDEQAKIDAYVNQLELGAV